MEIERRSGLTPATFLADYVRPRRPVVITDVAPTWRALSTWTIAELRRRAAHHTVVVEEGNVVQADRPRVRMTLGTYFDLVDSGVAEQRRLYLAGFDLFRCVPEARAEVDFSLLARKRLHYRRAWIGAAGTGSGYHRDIADNVLVQIVGDKQVHLVSPADDDCMYRSRRYELLTDASSVDLERWDPARHPRYAAADVAELVLHPGEGVYLPINWWHATRATTTSISVNFGGATLAETARQWRRFGTCALHLMGLYRRGDCACHPAVVEHRA